MEWRVIEFQNVTLRYIILKQNIVYGVKCEINFQNLTISHTYIETDLYIWSDVIQFQNLINKISYVKWH